MSTLYLFCSRTLFCSCWQMNSMVDHSLFYVVLLEQKTSEKSFCFICSNERFSTEENPSFLFNIHTMQLNKRLELRREREKTENKMFDKRLTICTKSAKANTKAPRFFRYQPFQRVYWIYTKKLSAMSIIPAKIIMHCDLNLIILITTVF